MDEMKKKYILIDENGEIKGEFDADEHKMINKTSHENQLKGLEKKRTKELFMTRNFTFTQMEHAGEVIYKLPVVDCGRILILTSYLRYDNVIAKFIKPLNWEEVGELLKLKERSLRLFKRTMLDNGIITEELNEKNEFELKLNPRYHFRGRTEDNKLLKSYHSSIRSLKNKLTAKELGFLYKLTLLTHYHTNIICANPFESDPTVIQYMNNKQIAHAFDLSEVTASKLLKKLISVGVIAVFRRMSKGSRIYVVNPYVFYRGKRPDMTLLTLFSATEYAKNKI